MVDGFDKAFSLLLGLILGFLYSAVGCVKGLCVAKNFVGPNSARREVLFGNGGLLGIAPPGHRFAMATNPLATATEAAPLSATINREGLRFVGVSFPDRP